MHSTFEIIFHFKFSLPVSTSGRNDRKQSNANWSLIICFVFVHIRKQVIRRESLRSALRLGPACDHEYIPIMLDMDLTSHDKNAKSIINYLSDTIVLHQWPRRIDNCVNKIENVQQNFPIPESTHNELTWIWYVHLETVHKSYESLRIVCSCRIGKWSRNTALYMCNSRLR